MIKTNFSYQNKPTFGLPHTVLNNMDADTMAAPAEQAETAIQKVFVATELLEMILLNLRQPELLSARLVNRRYNQVIQGSNDVRRKLGVVMPDNQGKLLWDFHGPTATIKEALASATPGQYEAPTLTQNGYGGHVFQVYQPNTPFFAFPTAVVPGPPPGFQPVNAAQQGLCFKIITLLDQEKLQRRFYRDLQTMQGHLMDSIGSMRWTSPALPTVPSQRQVSLLSGAFITSPPCNKAIVKWLVKLRNAGGRERWRIRTVNVTSANGVDVEGIATAVQHMMQTLVGVTVIDWELQVLPEYGLFPTEQEKVLVA